MSSHQQRLDLLDSLTDALTPHLADRGLDLEAVEVSNLGRRALVRVLVDKDGGVNLDDIAETTKDVSQLLDTTDVMGDAPYTLEVTSPGIERPLTLPRHWRRNVDRLVNVKHTNGNVTKGRVLSAGDQSCTLDVDGTPTELVYAEVASAKVEIEFNRPKRKE